MRVVHRPGMKNSEKIYVVEVVKGLALTIGHVIA